MSQARPITSNQIGPHNDVPTLVKKHLHNKHLRPVAEHTQKAFDDFIQRLASWRGDVFLDACCGVGESTINLARAHPDVMVVGIDKSIARLNKHTAYQNKIEGDSPSNTSTNYCLIQADLNDFWPLLYRFLQTHSNDVSWRIAKQFILYPNPYPKKSQLGKRWHGSPIMPSIVGICANIELRSNWRIYLEEFATAMSVLGHSTQVQRLSIHESCLAMTPFERKYAQAGQPLYVLTNDAFGCDKKNP